jgi:hypothetical protein
MLMIDEIASARALNYGIPRSLHVPIAAVDEGAITSYVGEILQTLSGNGQRRAFLVKTYTAPFVDAELPIWDIPASAMFFHPLQVWVHVDYGRYRHAYRRAFPNENIAGVVLSHAVNRRVAPLMGFEFVRITPTSRSANSSSAFSEEWGVALHSEPSQMAANRKRGAFVQYADLTALMLMMDMKLGGGVMNAVNEGQKLIRPRTGAA